MDVRDGSEPTGPGQEQSAPGASGLLGGALAGLALSIVVFMQIGTLAKPLGEVGHTRVADWLDLLTPWVVVGFAALTLVRATMLTSRRRPDRASWLLLGAGTVAFAQGAGLHLAANSIHNVGPSGDVEDVTYLWDEQVSHWIWYVGLLLLLAAVVRTVMSSEPPALVRTTVPGLILAVLVGFTLFTTWVEGQTPWLGLAAAGGATVIALRSAAPGRSYVLASFGPALVLLLGWGGYWLVADGVLFPEFSDLGWI